MDRFTYTPSTGVSAFSFRAPAVTMVLNPDGTDGYATFNVYQQILSSFPSQTLGMYAVLQGNHGTGILVLDPNTGAMTLSVSPGVTGIIRAGYGANIDSNYLLDFVFQTDPITDILTVIQSTNTLGLSLPMVGSSPDFSVILPTLSASFPMITPGGSVGVTMNAGQTAEFINNAPEPRTLSPVAAAIAAIAGFRKVRRAGATKADIR